MKEIKIKLPNTDVAWVQYNGTKYININYVPRGKLVVEVIKDPSAT